MKQRQILGLAAIAVSAVMSLAGTASATTLTSPEGTVVANGATVHASSDGPVKFKTNFGTTECDSTLKGTVSNNGASAVEITVSELTWAECTPGACSSKTLKTGGLAIRGSGSGNGSLTGVGQEVETNCFGLNCVWSTGTGTSLGTITGSESTGTTGTFDISATLARTGGTSGGFCGSTWIWSGSYTFTAPDPLYIE